MSKPGCLYLLSMHIGNDSEDLIPPYLLTLYKKIDIVVTEKAKTTRQFFSSISIDVHSKEFIQLKHNRDSNLYTQILKNLQSGKDVGLMSESGIPCIADPGSQIVKLSHKNNIRVVPTIGPSSIFLALSASGLNGQSFEFHGYLPKEYEKRRRVIAGIEKDSRLTGKTHIFMETPYKNVHILRDLVEVCNPETFVCVAKNVTMPNEFIQTRKLENWKNDDVFVKKENAIFILQYDTDLKREKAINIRGRRFRFKK